jgi:flagellar basal-body rod protein FlgF
VSNGVYSGVEAMVANQRRMDFLANNLANSSTHAFKRQTTFLHTLEAGRRGHEREQLVARVATDFTQGELTRTGNLLHLALTGKGFLAVEGERGEMYTRLGTLQIDPDGSLQTLDGFPLAWESLQGTIDPTGVPIRIDGEGVVSQDDFEVGRLRLVDFEDDQRLTQDSLGYYHAPLDLLETAHTASVTQGALEGSNVQPVQEMVAMISVQRAFAGASNLLGMIGETYRRLSRLQ